MNPSVGLWLRVDFYLDTIWGIWKPLATERGRAPACGCVSCSLVNVASAAVRKSLKYLEAARLAVVDHVLQNAHFY